MDRRRWIVLAILVVVAGVWIGTQRAGPDLLREEALTRSQTLRAAGDLKQAAGVWTDYIRRHPDEAQAWVMRGTIRSELMGGCYAPAWMQKSELLIWARFSRYFGAAEHDLQRARKLDPSLITPVVRLAEMEYVRSGSSAARDYIQQAQEMLDARIEQDPDELQLYELRLQASTFEGDYDAAEADVDRIAALPEDDAQQRADHWRDWIATTKKRTAERADYRRRIDQALEPSPHRQRNPLGM